MIAEYERLAREAERLHGSRAVLFLQVGSFYEMYWVPGVTAGAENAEAARMRMSLTCMKPKHPGPPSRSNPCAAGFPMGALDKFDALLEDGWTVCLADQVPGTSPIRRELARCLSPSMRQDSGTPDKGQRSGNYACCVLERRGVSGAAFIDVSTGRTVVTDGEGIGAAAASRNVTEVVLLGCPSRAAEFPGTMTHVLELNDPSVRDALATCSVRDVLDQAYGRRGPCLTEDMLLLGSRPESRDALAYLLTFTRRHSLQLGVGLPPPDIVDSTRLVRFSPSALRQLGVFQLDAVLNKAVTPPGKRWFRHRLCTPFARPADVRDELDAVQAALDTDVDAVRACLSRTGDLERLTRRVLQGTLQLTHVETVVQQLDALVEAATACGAPEIAECASAFSSALLPALPADAPFSSVDACSNARAAIADAKADLEAATKAVHEAARIDVSADGNYRMLLTNARYKGLDPEIKAGLTATQMAGGMRLWSAKLQALSDVLKDAETELKRSLDVAWASVLDSSPRGKLVIATEWARDADVTWTAAWNARKFGHVRPRVTDDEGGAIRAKDLGNPVAEACMESYTTERYVRNDVTLDGTDQHILLSSINAAGKSTLLRAVGMCVIMAQAGMFAPCSSLELSPFVRIDTRILTPDDVERGLSSFTAEVMEAREALAAASPSSLFLADELFCSTEWRSGTALVGTMICRLGDKGTRTFVTTHYHELMQHPGINGLSTLRVMHLGMVVTEAGVTFERRLRDGPCNPNYGIMVASAYGFDAAFIREATSAREIVGGIPGPKRSRYNRKLVVSKCEVCGGVASDSHHIRHRADAIDGRHADGVHEHHVSNLMALCEACHTLAHAPGVSLTRVHTLAGPAALLKSPSA